MLCLIRTVGRNKRSALRCCCVTPTAFASCQSPRSVNPVKHGLVTRVRDWPHSSFHRDVRAELFPADWAGDVAAEGDFGER
jgi:hypothetical protein